MNYKEKLRDPRWQKKRLEILKRDKWKCKLCKDEKTELHVHHINYTGEPWEAPNSDLVTLCAHCHVEVEQIEVQVEFKKIRIYKSHNWGGGSRIMFVNCGVPELVMRIYDRDGECMIGYNLPPERRRLMISILK
jgi:hypothetical protein